MPCVHAGMAVVAVGAAVCEVVLGAGNQGARTGRPCDVVWG